MRKLCFALSIIFCMTVLQAGFAVFADTEETVVMTLEEAQAKALENNTEYKYQDSVIRDAVNSYADAEESYDKQSAATTRSYIDYFNKPINLEVTLQSAANKVKTARLKKDNIKRTSDQNILKLFVSIKKAQTSLEEAQADVLLKQKSYEAAKAKYELDYITEAALKQAALARESAEDAVSSALESLQKEIQTLNRYTGRALTDYNIQPVITLNMIDVNAIDLDKIRKDIIANREDFVSLTLSTELAQRKYDLTKERYEEFVIRMKVQNSWEQMQEAYDQATTDYEDERQAFEEKTIDLDMELNTAYNAIKDAVDSIHSIEEDIETAKADAEKARIKYDMDVISKEKYEEAERSIKALQNRLGNSIADLHVQYAALMMYSDQAK